MFLDGQRLQVTPSIGMALIPDHGSTPTDLLKRADIALYRAKDSGRNTSQMFHATMQKARSEEHTSELQSLMRISYAVFCLKKKKTIHNTTSPPHQQCTTHLLNTKATP